MSDVELGSARDRSPAHRVIPRASRYWQEGPRKVGWVSVTVGLLALYLGGIAYAVYTGLRLNDLAPVVRTALVLSAFVASVVPILFWWRQTWHFETWMERNPLQLSAEELEFERIRFKTNSDFARTFWTAVVVVFAGLLISFRP